MKTKDNAKVLSIPCLISHIKNSRLSNFMPNSKKEYYQKNPIDSIIQHLMMKFEKWDENTIEEHSQTLS